MYRQKDGSGCPYILVDEHSLWRAVVEETARFLKERPKQFENIEAAGGFSWARFTALGHRVTKRVAEEELK